MFDQEFIVRGCECGNYF